jgi:hypothetical protein
MAGRYDDEDLGEDVDIDELLAGGDDDDDDEELGARKARERKKKGGSSGKKETILLAGIPLTSIGFGQNLLVKTEMNEDFRPRYLAVETAAQICRITDFVVGTKNMNISGNAIPCSAFAANSVVSALRGYVIKSGKTIDLRVFNPAASGTIEFCGVWFGPALVGS